MATAGLGIGTPVTVLASPVLGPLVGWDAIALVYLIWVWASLARRDAHETAHLAVREDPNRALRDLLLLLAGLASLLAVGVILATGTRHGLTRDLYVLLGVISVVLSWGVVHTVFATRYARLYYTGPDGGIDFNQPDPPRYADFAYLAFTVGMTFQVSDTNVTTGEMRRAILGHAMLSYLFGAVIIAASVNLLAGLAR